MEPCEADIKELRKEVGAITVSLAVADSKLQTLITSVERATGERTKIASELGAYGIQLSKFVTEIANLKDAVSELRPQVQGLVIDRTAAVAAVKTSLVAGGVFTKFVYVIGAGLIALGTLIIGWLLGGRHLQP